MTEEKQINEVLQEAIIRYSQVWEDYDLLIKGLNIGPDDHILSIASAGCNALAMLLEEPRSVTAVDLNPSQTAVCHLKKAAISKLYYEEFIVLMGVRTGHDRWALYQQIRPDMPEDAQAFWDKNRDVLDMGIVHCGRLEKYFRVFQEKFISAAVPDDVLENYLNQGGSEAQKEFFEKYFNEPRFKETFKQYTSRDMIAEHGRDHSQFKFVEVEDVGQFFHDRFRHVCEDLPTKDNFYLEFLLTSNYADLTKGPAYLRPENYLKLRSLMPRFHILNKPLDACIQDFDPGHYSKANLSDLFEYLSEEQTEGFLKTLGEGMREGGRIAYWNLLVPRSRPESLANILTPKRELAKSLWENDRAFFYGDFHIDEIVRG